MADIVVLRSKRLLTPLCVCVCVCVCVCMCVFPYILSGELGGGTLHYIVCTVKF